MARKVVPATLEDSYNLSMELIDGAKQNKCLPILSYRFYWGKIANPESMQGLKNMHLSCKYLQSAKIKSG